MKHLKQTFKDDDYFPKSWQMDQENISTAKDMKYCVYKCLLYHSFNLAYHVLQIMNKRFGATFKSDEKVRMELERTYSAMTRYAPSAQIALELFEQFKQLYGSPSSHTYTCTIFSLAIVENPDMDKFDELYKEATLLNKVTPVTKTVLKIATNKQTSQDFGTASNGDDDIMSFSTYGDVATICIDTSNTNHADKRMKDRAISLEDIQKCIKYGTKYKAKHRLVKCTDGKLIVIYHRTSDLKHHTIVTAYRNLPKGKYNKYAANSTQQQPNYLERLALDALLSQANQVETTNGFDGVFDHMLQSLEEQTMVTLKHEWKEAIISMIKSVSPSLQFSKKLIDFLAKHFPKDAPAKAQSTNTNAKKQTANAVPSQTKNQATNEIKASKTTTTTTSTAPKQSNSKPNTKGIVSSMKGLNIKK